MMKNMSKMAMNPDALKGAMPSPNAQVCCVFACLCMSLHVSACLCMCEHVSACVGLCVSACVCVYISLVCAHTFLHTLNTYTRK